MEESNLEEQLKLEKEKREESNKKIEELKRKIQNAYQKLDSILSTANSPSGQSEIIRNFHSKISNQDENIEIPDGSAVFEELQLLLKEQKEKFDASQKENEEKQKEIDNLKRRLKVGFDNVDSYLGGAQNEEEKQNLIKEFQEKRKESNPSTLEIKEGKSMFYQDLERQLSKVIQDKEKRIEELKQKIHNVYNKLDSILSSGKSQEEKIDVIQEFHQKLSNEEQNIEIPSGSSLYNDLNTLLKKQREQYEQIKKENEEKEKTIKNLKSRPIYLLMIIGLLLGYIVFLLISKH